MKLRDIMQREMPTAFPEESATTAWERMRASGADYLVVTDKGTVAGILAWHDLSGPSGGTRRRMGRRVGDLMHRTVTSATPGTSVARGAASMRRHRTGCLAILSRQKLVGIVTTSEMLGVLAEGAVG
jgi:CBS domain-containing protein